MAKNTTEGFSEGAIEVPPRHGLRGLATIIPSKAEVFVTANHLTAHLRLLWITRPYSTSSQIRQSRCAPVTPRGSDDSVPWS